jgi:sirohydrochlorin ferrochelatase
MEFYRNEYVSQGYTERGLLTVVSEGTFSMVFDGDPSGKAVVIQSVDLGDGSRTVAIRLEEV